MAAQPIVGSKVTVKSSGRVGRIRIDDGSDMPYKVAFDDGAMPAADWFKESDVCLVLPSPCVTAYGDPTLAPVSTNMDAKTANSTSIEAKLASWMGHGEDVGSMPAGCGPASTWQPPKGTPVHDEWFLSLGSHAPMCPVELSRKATSGPITLDVLQGEWLCGSGASISVAGTEVHMNGLPLKYHSVELSEDGTVARIGSLWRLDCWADNGSIQFRSTTFQNDMEARKEVWTRRDPNMSPQLERVRLLGYAGGDALSGGLPQHIKNSKDAEDVALLTALVAQWREPDLLNVRPCSVVPDFVNRAQTGLGVELLHYIAGSMRDQGFRKRRGTEGHDIPVVVRESPDSPNRAEALVKWQARISEEMGFPPVQIEADEELFTSLGNGHFFQALNLFANEWPAINEDGVRYTIGNDAALVEAITSGVSSIVLKEATPRPVRSKIAVLLNSKREFFWTLNDDGNVDVSQMEESMLTCSQFEWLSRGMDAVYVNCLVRTHLGIKESHRQQM